MNLVAGGTEAGLPGVSILYELGYLGMDFTNRDKHSKAAAEGRKEQLRSMLEDRVWKTFSVQTYDPKTGKLLKEMEIMWGASHKITHDTILAAVSNSQAVAEKYLMDLGFKRVKALTKIPNWNYHGEHQVTILMYKYPKKKEQIEVETGSN